MRRIYYRFPQRVDLSFAMGMPFNETLKYIAGFDNEESTKTTGKELVRVKTKVKIAIDRATFGDITPDDLRPGVITEAVRSAGIGARARPTRRRQGPDRKRYFLPPAHR